MTDSPTAPPATARSPRLLLGAGLVVLAFVAALVALRRDEDQPPVDGPKLPKSLQPTDLLLELDGMRITWGDVADQVAWLDELAPEYSLQKKVLKVLPEHTIPVLFARREFGAQREEMRQLAETLRKGVGNVNELEKAAVDRNFRRAPMTRGDMTVPVARFLFDETNVGGVSQPIEVPMGFVVVGAFDLKQARAPMEDVVEAGMLGFFTHDERAFADWSNQLRERIRTRVTYVHPDFRLAMPPWLVLP